MEIRPEEERAVWAQMQLSPYQRVIHNELVQKILEDRTKLENCKAEELVAIQQRNAARRELLGIIHRNDKKQ
jgi:hypothetical protein